MFHDGEEEPEKRPEGPDLHYFRSWSLQGEADYLKQKWRECLSSELIIPSPIIKLYDENGDYVSQKVYLHQFVPNALQNLPNSPDTHQEALHLDVNPPLISSINDPVEYDDEEINDEISISLAVLEGDNDISQNTLIADDLIDLPETSFNQERASENYHNLTAAEELSHVDQNLEDTINKGGDRSKKSHQRILSSATNSTSSPKRQRAENTCADQSNIQAPVEFKCMIARRLSKVLGKRESLKVLDKKRTALKNNTNNKSFQADYEQALAKVQSEVLAEHRQLSQQFKSWDKEYAILNSHEASADDIEKGPMKDVYKKMTECKAYLKHWKIKIDS